MKESNKEIGSKKVYLLNGSNIDIQEHQDRNNIFAKESLEKMGFEPTIIGNYENGMPNADEINFSNLKEEKEINILITMHGLVDDEGMLMVVQSNKVAPVSINKFMEDIAKSIQDQNGMVTVTS